MSEKVCASRYDFFAAHQKNLQQKVGSRLDMTHFSPIAPKKSSPPNQQAQAAQQASPKPTPMTVATNSPPSPTPPQATPH
jgi:hypothetical protein